MWTNVGAMMYMSVESPFDNNNRETPLTMEHCIRRPLLIVHGPDMKTLPPSPGDF